MRRPKILQQFRRRVIRVPDNALSDYPVSFSAVLKDGTVMIEASVPRNRLGRLIELARTKEHYGLPTIGLHGVTRFECREARVLAMDLRAMLQMGEPIEPPWLAVIEIVARGEAAALVVSAGL